MRYARRVAGQGALDVGLHAALRSGSSTTINHALHAYAAIGDPAGAERAVREVLVAPAVAGVLDKWKSAGADALPDVRPGLAQWPRRSRSCTCPLVTHNVLDARLLC
jgi:hypothetical protein